MSADLSVSPADTPRDPIDEAEDFIDAALVGKEWEVRDSDGEPPTWVERGVGAECERFIETPLSYAESCRIERLLEVAREFLAVGERDKAEAAKWKAEATRYKAQRSDAYAHRSRDGRQIARLTEALDEARETLWEFDKTTVLGFHIREWKQRLFRLRVKLDALASARAVLADEDAGRSGIDPARRILPHVPSLEPDADVELMGDRQKPMRRRKARRRRAAGEEDARP